MPKEAADNRLRNKQDLVELRKEAAIPDTKLNSKEESSVSISAFIFKDETSCSLADISYLI